MEQAARVGLRGSKGRIKDRHRRAKKFFVPELRQLQTELQCSWPSGRTPAASAEAIRQFVSHEIETGRGLLNLKSNRKQLLTFLRDEVKALAFRGRQGPEDACTPTQFCHDWFAHSENLSLEYVRQRLVAKKISQGKK